jgi:hypothetical protein
LPLEARDRRFILSARLTLLEPTRALRARCERLWPLAPLLPAAALPRPTLRRAEAARRPTLTALHPRPAAVLRDGCCWHDRRRSEQRRQDLPTHSGFTPLPAHFAGPADETLMDEPWRLSAEPTCQHCERI